MSTHRSWGNPSSLCRYVKRGLHYPRVKCQEAAGLRPGALLRRPMCKCCCSGILTTCSRETKSLHGKHRDHCSRTTITKSPEKQQQLRSVFFSRTKPKRLLCPGFQLAHDRQTRTQGPQGCELRARVRRHAGCGSNAERNILKQVGCDQLLCSFSFVVLVYSSLRGSPFHSVYGDAVTCSNKYTQRCARTTGALLTYATAYQQSRLSC